MLDSTPLLLSIRDFFEIFGMMTGFEKIRPSFGACVSAFERGGFSHVLFNNFLPTISLKVAFAARARGLRTFMWVHNFRLDCANGLHFDGKNICHQCLNSWEPLVFFPELPTLVGSIFYLRSDLSFETGCAFGCSLYRSFYL